MDIKVQLVPAEPGLWLWTVYWNPKPAEGTDPYFTDRVRVLAWQFHTYPSTSSRAEVTLSGLPVGVTGVGWEECDNLVDWFVEFNDGTCEGAMDDGEDPDLNSIKALERIKAADIAHREAMKAAGFDPCSPSESPSP